MILSILAWLTRAGDVAAAVSALWAFLTTLGPKIKSILIKMATKDSGHDINAIIKRNDHVYAQMRVLQVTFEVDRIEIFQFHNGGKFYSGEPMQKMSCTYETSAPGISSEVLSLQNIPISMYPVFLLELVRNQGIAVPDTTMLDTSYTYPSKGAGVESFYVKPIYNLTGAMVGFVMFSFIKNINVISCEADEAFDNFAKSIAGYI